ncbi:MAG TPA: alpha/beta fold hydrolase [Nevskia sp.]|nr:alpha/beta fold hydrolase [Nevskia sp.]
MSELIRQARMQGLALNQRLAGTITNGFDWLFRSEQLVKSGKTWFELVYDGDPMSVRYYGLPEEDEIELADGSRMAVERNQHPVPLVLVPPLGVTANTFDLMPERSLARYMAARGFRTYLIDWGKPEKRHAQLGMKDYADDMMSLALARIRKHAGTEPLSLMGWCMGGLLCLLHAGLEEDPRIVNLVTIASPIDMRGGGIVAGLASAINAPAQLLRKYTEFRLHALDPATMQMPAWFTTLAFKLTDPVGSVTTYWDLLTRLWDREFVTSHTTTSNYLNNMLMYPAGVLQDMLVKVGVDNSLSRGEIELGERVSRFDRIHAALLVIAGENDVLVPPPIAKTSVDLVASGDKRFTIAAGGHMGVILGSKARLEVWAPAADWLAERSQAGTPDKPRRKTRKS